MGKPTRAEQSARIPSPRFWRETAPLVLGLAVALGVGWFVFPHVLYSRQAQPLEFNHALHLENGAQCATCHFLRADGSFSGQPAVETCAECHAAPLGDSLAEARLIEEYIRPGKEIPWKSYAGQPAHVFFSHAAHGLLLCTACHADMARSASLPDYQENRWTGYSRDVMPMDKCERCHAEISPPDAAPRNDCAVCHK